MSFSIKTKIISGESSLDFLNKLNMSKVFLVTDPFMKKNGMINIVLEKLPKNCEYTLFTDVKPDPSQELVNNAINTYIKNSADIVIAMGGGSAIDLAKAMIDGIVKEHKKSKPIFLAIPTTAGTGSEVTNFAVVTRGQDKEVLIDDILLADYALLIPSVTKSVPNFITADTGMDVLTHALEAYMSKNSNTFTDCLAIKAIKLVFSHLEIIYNDGLRMRSREAMLEASTIAGIAFTNAGLGINHSLAHTIGGRFHVAHGRLNAILLPFVLRFNINRCEDCKNKLESLSKELDLASYEDLIKKIKDLNSRLEIPENLSGLGKIDINDYRNSVSEMASIALNDRCTPTNPGYITKFDLANLLHDIY